MNKKRPSSTSIRFNPQDLLLLDALQKKTGITKQAEIVRTGLRALAAKEGLDPNGKPLPK